jgi:hypothetical protein
MATTVETQRLLDRLRDLRAELLAEARATEGTRVNARSLAMVTGSLMVHIEELARILTVHLEGHRTVGPS